MNQNIKFYYMCRRVTNEDPSLILNELTELFENDLIPDQTLLKNWNEEFRLYNLNNRLQSKQSYKLLKKRTQHKNVIFVFNTTLPCLQRIEFYVLCRHWLRISVNRILAETRIVFGMKEAPSSGTLNDWIKNNLFTERLSTSMNSSSDVLPRITEPKSEANTSQVLNGSQVQKKDKSNLKPRPRFENVSFSPRQPNQTNNIRLSVQFEKEVVQPGTLLFSIKKEKIEANELNSQNGLPAIQTDTVSKCSASRTAASTDCHKNSLNEQMVAELKARVAQLQTENENLKTENKSQNFTAQMESLKVENQNLKTKNEKLESNQVKILTGYFKEIFDLKEKNTLAEGKIKDKETEINELKKRLESQHPSNASLKTNEAGINELKKKCLHQEKRLAQTDSLLLDKDKEISRLKNNENLNFLILKSALDEIYNEEEYSTSLKHNDFCQQIERLKDCFQISNRNFQNLMTQVDLLQQEIKRNSCGFTSEIQDLKIRNDELVRQKNELEYQIRRFETNNKENMRFQGRIDFSNKRRRFN